MKNVPFHAIDLRSWPRAQMFYYFSRTAPTGYSLTTQLDVTIMRSALKKENIRFFPAYLWLVTKMLNRQIAFKVAVKDETLGYWDSLTPLYAVFHDDDKTISLMWTAYCETFSKFYERYLENHRRFQQQHGVLSQPEPPPNSYTVSCIPWIGFEHFAVHSYDNKAYYFPSVESGGFIERHGAVMMPLSITAHHATTDGWHIKEFLGGLQDEMNHPKAWL